MREIVLDTETTGLSVNKGDKITEIGCVEIIDKVVTDRTFHAYINPEREVSVGAVEISGLTYDFLKKFPIFSEVADDFLNFIGNDRLVIHNAPFDVGFLNYELKLSEKNSLQNEIIDTLVIAKKKYPGSPSTLDALCKRFKIDKSMRTKHGALIDAELLAHVYIAMSVAVKQNNLFDMKNDDVVLSIVRKNIAPRSFNLSDEELAAHKKLLENIKNPIWVNYDATN